jgi:hypothetical protein
MGVTELKSEEESSRKYDDLFAISMRSVDRIRESELTSTSSSPSPEIVIMVPVAEVGDGESTVCIGATLWM